MSKRRCVLSALALVLAGLGGGTTVEGAQAAPARRFVNASNIAPGHVAWIRSGPGVNYARVGYLRPTSRHVLALDCRRIARDNWCRVRFQGTRGWIQDRFIRAPHVMTG